MPGTKMRSFGTESRVGHDSSDFYSRKIYSNPRADSDLSVENEVPCDCLNRVHVHSSENMDELPSNCVHLMVTSPPYNVGKEYDNDLTLDEYRSLLRRVWSETYRVLVDGGRICVNVANIGRKPYLPLNAWITTDLLELGFSMRGEIIWNKSASAGSSCAWGSWKSASNPVLRDVHEYIMVFNKGSFARKKHVNQQSTIERDQFLEWTKSVWNFAAESAKRVQHPAPFPIELPMRAIQLYTFKNDVVLDPFMGSGTTAVAATRAGRNWIGYEISSKYANLVDSRILYELEKSRNYKLD